MIDWVKLSIIAAVVVAIFGAGWGANGWRLNGEIDKIKATDAQAAETATNTALKEQKDRYDAAALAQNKLWDADKQELAKLKGAKDEVERLRDCVARGTCGLRVRAVCPPSGDVPAAAKGGVVGPGAPARLDPAAEPAYFSLRLGLAVTQRTLAACQAALRTVTGQ